MVNKLLQNMILMYQFGECHLVYNVNVCILQIIFKRIYRISIGYAHSNKGQSMSQEEKLPKILIVEDDERLARLTQEYLIRNGLEVGVEPDGNRAIRRIIAEQPDLVCA